MSYSPRSKRVRRAMEALRRNPPKSRVVYTDIRTPIRRKDLRELLIAYYCPIVCEGVVKGEEWHKTCETAADAALELMEAQMPTRVHLDAPANRS